MQFIVNTAGQIVADAIDLCQVVNTCSHQSLQSAETRQQPLPALGANAGNLFKRRRLAGFAASRAVALNGKAMCFVPDLLNQVQCRMFGG